MKISRFHKWVLITAAGLTLPAMAMARSQSVDGYAALVNDRVITVGEILAIVQPIRAQLAETFDGTELDKKMEQAYREGMDALIERALILEEFTAMGGSIPDRAADDQINVMINERFKNDRTAFLEALAEDRMTLDDWREETKNRLIVNLMRRREVTDRVILAPRAVRDLYESRSTQYQVPEQIQLSMIVLHKGASTNDLAVKKNEAAQIRESSLPAAISQNWPSPVRRATRRRMAVTRAGWTPGHCARNWPRLSPRSSRAASAKSSKPAMIFTF